MSGGRVLVYDHTAALPARVREATATWDPRPEVVACGRPRALSDLLTGERFDVLVAGPGLDTRAGWERLRIIREELPAMALVLALDGTFAPDVHDVVRAGAVDVLDVPLALEEAAPVLARALAIARRVQPRPPVDAGGADDEGAPEEDAAGEDVSVGDPAGAVPVAEVAVAEVDGPAAVAAVSAVPTRVIGIAAASGGCGKTFLATNLAWYLHRRGGRRVCIVDLDLQFGEVASTLRLRPTASVVDLLRAGQERGEDLADLIEAHVEHHDSGVAVLAAPLDPTEAELVGPDDVVRVLDAARRRFDDLVVDTPPVLTDAVVAALDRCDELLVVATLDVPSVRTTHLFLGTLERLGVGGEDLRLLLNKAEADAGIETSQILGLFPQGFEATLPYAREVLRSVNAGRPVLDSSPDATISRELEGVLQRLLPPDARAAADPRPARSRPARARRWGRKLEETVA